MERLLKCKFSTATLGEKKANVKREVAFALLSPSQAISSRNDIQASDRQVSAPLEMMVYT